MFTSEDILARLQNGDSVDEIATEMANALNAAKTSYDEAEAKRIEEEKKINQEKEAKRATIQRIVNDFAVYAELIGKQEIADKLDAMTDSDFDDLADAIDVMIELIEMTENFKVLGYGNIFSPVGVKKTPKPVKENVKPTPDDIISEFLKTL